MKIFLFSITDGLGVCSVRLARGLAAKDPVTIALHGPEADELLTEFPDFFQESQFHRLVIPHCGFPDPRKIWQSYRVHRAITRNKPDVLHVHLGGLFTAAFAVLWLAHQSALSMVAPVHGPWYQLRPGKTVIRLNGEELETIQYGLDHTGRQTIGFPPASGPDTGLL